MKINKTTQKIMAFIVMFILRLITAPEAHAVCPVCTVAVIGGLGLSRYLGIDDLVSGIWLGGLIISVSFWTAGWVQKKKFKFLEKLGSQAITLFSILFWTFLIYLPLWYGRVIGHPFNKVLGTDKLIVGGIFGATAFLIGVFADKRVREIFGRQLFSFQRVVFPLFTLVVTSLAVYFYSGYLK